MLNWFEIISIQQNIRKVGFMHQMTSCNQFLSNNCIRETNGFGQQLNQVRYC